MVPTLGPGDRVVVLRGCGPWRPAVRIGDLVALADPRHPARTMVKRVAAFDGRHVVVRGDNEVASTDSRQFGPVDPRHLRGRVIYRYHPEHRRGWFGTRSDPLTRRALRWWKLPPGGRRQ